MENRTLSIYYTWGTALIITNSMNLNLNQLYQATYTFHATTATILTRAFALFFLAYNDFRNPFTTCSYMVE